jgi:hypothetical protein
LEQPHLGDIMLETSTFDIILNKSITDLNGARGVLDAYFFNDRLIESFEKEQNRQKNLIPAFKRKTRAMQGDIELLEKYQFKGQLPHIEEQNIKLIDLLGDILILNSRFYGHNIEPNNEAKELRLKMQELLKKMKEKINMYNEKIGKLNYKMVSWEEAEKEAYQRWGNL